MDSSSCFRRFETVPKSQTKIKAGLEAAGHYSYNILGFLLDNDLPVYVMNPLYTKTESTSSSGTNVESIL